MTCSWVFPLFPSGFQVDSVHERGQQTLAAPVSEVPGPFFGDWANKHHLGAKVGQYTTKRQPIHCPSGFCP